MTPEYGAATQLEKIDIRLANLIAINKFDKKGSLDALRDVQKQYQRNNQRFEEKVENMLCMEQSPHNLMILEQIPSTKLTMDKLKEKKLGNFNSNFEITEEMSEKIFVIPPNRIRYLSEIAESNRNYDNWSLNQKIIAKIYISK